MVRTNLENTGLEGWRSVDSTGSSMSFLPDQEKEKQPSPADAKVQPIFISYHCSPLHIVLGSCCAYTAFVLQEDTGMW